MQNDGLCRYADIFGLPGKGAHAYRLFNIAIVDVLGTAVLAYAAYKLVNPLFKIKVNFWLYFVIALVIGEILHKLFCVKTTISRAV